MKRFHIYLLAALFASSLFAALPVSAQSETPPTGPVGEVHGTIINRNNGKVVAETLDVMLHVLDQDLADKDMQHAQSANDGTFAFANISFEPNVQFVAMATYQGVTYSSKVTPVDLKSMQVNIDVPVYETTNELTGVHIDQMHVMFDFAEDGLETKEIYVISNANERTVKEAVQADEQHLATLKFPLPVDADYIFFKPDEQNRFIKFGGGFADANPILPKSNSQFMVSYLVPYIGQREYTYTAPLNISQINFLIPAQSGISLQGSGLIGPESMTLENNTSYNVYSYAGLQAGQTVRVTIRGDLTPEPAQSTRTKSWLPIGAAFLGVVFMGVGVWWWRRPANTEDNNDIDSADSTFDNLILEIAKLDEMLDQGKINSETHQLLRQELMQQAKKLL